MLNYIKNNKKIFGIGFLFLVTVVGMIKVFSNIDINH